MQLLGVEVISDLSGWAAAAAAVAAASVALGQIAAKAAQRGKAERSTTAQHDLFNLFELDRRP
jgi:hypothetical protein